MGKSTKASVRLLGTRVNVWDFEVGHDMARARGGTMQLTNLHR